MASREGSGYLAPQKARKWVMKVWKIAAALLCALVCASAQAATKPCDDLKAEIAKKLDAKGVTNYMLTIVDKGKEANGNVVGSCQGGTKSIVYSKGTPATQPKPGGEKNPK